MANLWLDPESEKEQQAKVERMKLAAGDLVAFIFLLMLLLSMAIVWGTVE